MVKSVKEDLMEIICCPVCKRDLELKVTKRDKVEIITGKLTCHNCDVEYPITDGIPNLLPQEPRRKNVKG